MAKVQYVVSDSNRRSMFGATTGNGQSEKDAYRKAVNYWTGAPTGARLWRSNGFACIELFPERDADGFTSFPLDD